jgi:NADH:ubiquinone oxidoreductase subunit 6 (subunit J)
MKLLRAIGYGALGWVLIFFEVSALMFLLKLQPGLAYYAIHYAAAAAIAAFCAWFYFDSEKTKGGIGEGILAGIAFVLTGAALDAAITVPFFVKSYAFFNDAYLWIGFAETIIVSAIVGKINE